MQKWVSIERHQKSANVSPFKTVNLSGIYGASIREYGIIEGDIEESVRYLERRLRGT